jgi:hypothetical protein
LLDADADPDGRRDGVWNALVELAEVPAASAETGKARGWLVHRGTRYAVWLSPGCGRSGRIEDLVSVTIDRKTRRQIRELWRRSSVAKARKPSSKAVVAVWIALRDDQGLGLGSAFEKGLVELDHPAFGPLRRVIDEQLAHRPA